jgi:hypothetical protein
MKKYNALKQENSLNKNLKEISKNRNRLSDMNQHSKEESFQYNYSD